MIVHKPKNTFEITELYAFISSDEGGEGLCGAPIGGMTMPLIAADKSRVDSLRPIAKTIAEATGMRIDLIRFSVRENLETYGGKDHD